MQIGALLSLALKTVGLVSDAPSGDQLVLGDSAGLSGGPLTSLNVGETKRQHRPRVIW